MKALERMTANSATNDVQILVVDDEPDLRTLYELTLVRDGFSISTAACLVEAFAYLNERRFDVVITDMRLPDGLGVELIRHLKAQQLRQNILWN